MYGTVITLMLGISAAASAQAPLEIWPTTDAPPMVDFPYPCECPPLHAPRSAERRGGSQDVVLLWNDVTLKAIKAERTPPPVAARNLAIVHVAVYDAMNAVQGTHRPFRVRLTVPGASAEAAAAVAAHRALLDLYPKQVRHLDAALDEALEAIADRPAKTDGIRLGQTVAERVLEWRANDFASSASNYAPQMGLGRWQPTLPDYGKPLLPGWASVTPFALREMSALRPAGPPALTSEEFVRAYREVKVLGAANSRVRTRDETQIAHFWADGAGTVTPPGHWNRIARDAARQRGTTPAQNARLFAMLNVALADVAIACWDCKYHFDFWRPVTAIRVAKLLDNAELVPDAEWTPLLPTPPFPAYSSGHSSFSGSAAAVLAAFFGSDEIQFTSTSDGLPGVKRSFARFSDAANEAGMSRIYGGIHWNFDNTIGLEGGKKIGDYISRRHFQPIPARSP